RGTARDAHHAALARAGEFGRGTTNYGRRRSLHFLASLPPRGLVLIFTCPLHFDLQPCPRTVQSLRVLTPAAPTCRRHAGHTARQSAPSSPAPRSSSRPAPAPAPATRQPDPPRRPQPWFPASRYSCATRCTCWKESGWGSSPTTRAA